jgi:hypothetical protein
MGYIVVQNAREKGSRYLFLVDRSACKSKWWTPTLGIAMVFEKESAANIQASKLRKNHPRVVSVGRAMEMEKINEQVADRCAQFDDHPFSSDALGQW